MQKRVRRPGFEPESPPDPFAAWDGIIPSGREVSSTTTLTSPMWDYRGFWGLKWFGLRWAGRGHWWLAVLPLGRLLAVDETVPGDDNKESGVKPAAASCAPTLSPC